MTKRLRKEAFLILGILTVDHVSKSWVVSRGIEYTINKGGAFSLLDHWPFFGIVPLIAFLVLSALWIGLRRGEVGKWEEVGIVFMLGGSLSNLMDRFIYGGVVDFIRVTDVNWFNFADVGIAWGSGVLLWSCLRKDKIMHHGA